MSALAAGSWVFNKHVARRVPRLPLLNIGDVLLSRTLEQNHIFAGELAPLRTHLSIL